MVHQFGSERTKRAKPISIGLFKSVLVADSNLRTATDALSPFSDWEQDVKTKRDPAAHRMPLYVPPGAYTPEQIVEIDRYDDLKIEALRVEDFDRMSELRLARERVGIFVPKFLHDPGEKSIEIFPTVPQDIGKLVKVGRVVHTFLGNASSQP